MLIDKVTKQTYSCRNEAIRVLGKKEFLSRAKNNNLDYIPTYYA